MNFQPINKEAEATFKGIERRIFRLQSGGTIDSLRTIGADTSGHIGASFTSLKQLASCYAPDETLALLLWQTCRREEQIMACFLLPTGTNKEKITQLMDACQSMEIAGYVGSLHLARRPDVAEIAAEWADSEVPAKQAAALTAAARQLILKKECSLIPKSQFAEMLRRPYADPYVRMLAARYRFNL